MSKTVIGFKLLSKDAKLPTRSRDTDAGIDLYSCETHTVKIKPGETKIIHTGVAMEMPEWWDTAYTVGFGGVWDRSSLGSKGIHRLAGCIDQTYSGELNICLTNLNIYPVLTSLIAHEKKEVLQVLDKHSYSVFPGDKIAQIVLQPVYKGQPIEIKKIKSKGRGNKGFGSTGR